MDNVVVVVVVVVLSIVICPFKVDRLASRKRQYFVELVVGRQARSGESRRQIALLLLLQALQLQLAH